MPSSSSSDGNRSLEITMPELRGGNIGVRLARALETDYLVKIIDHNKRRCEMLSGLLNSALVLQGEIYALMDEGETLMKAGDVLIQRGTNHAWANRSDQMVRICFVLIDAKR